MEKRKSARAVVVFNGKLVAMYREKNNRAYYTFPGGGIEENESEEDCVKRECLEEFGINVMPIKKLYEYEDTKTKQSFILCNWVSGELGSGVGEEFSPDRNRGIYIPMLVDIKSLSKIPLVPNEVATCVFNDYMGAGLENLTEIKHIESDF